MPAVSKAQQRFMGMVHAAQKGEEPASKDVADVANDMSKKSAKDFASTKHKGLPNHVKEGSVTDRPEEPSSDDLNLPSSAIPGVSAESTLPTPTNNILWKATGKVCEGRSMVERIRMYEKKGGGWRMGKSTDEQVYNNLKEFYTNEIKPRKEAKELIVKRRMGESVSDDENMIRRIIKNLEETNKWLKKQISLNYKWVTAKDKENVKKSIAVNQTLINTYKENLKDLGENILREMTDEVGESDGVDHEVSMARASLINISKACQDLMGKIGSQEKDLPGWIQDHITNSENYILQASKGYHEIDDKLKGNTITGPTQLDQNGK
jgi:hypothetical protein